MVVYENLTINPPKFRSHRIFVTLATSVPFFFGLTWVYYRKYRVRNNHHRDFNDGDLKFMKRVNGNTIEKQENPGLRVQEHFIHPSELDDVRLDCRSLLKMNGNSYISEFAQETFDFQLGDLKEYTNVNTLRVTGRPRPGEKSVPKWGWGFQFDKNKVPTSIRNLALRIQSSKDFKVGELTDLTIEYRKDGYHRMDPHTYPGQDGVDVFFVNVIGPSVITFSPPGIEQRCKQQEIAEYSYTDKDIDVYLPQHALIHISDFARTHWKYSTRQGIKHPEKDFLCDWWGNPETIVERTPERLQIIFSFSRYL